MFFVAIQCLIPSNTVALECFSLGLLAFSEEEEEEEEEKEEGEEKGRERRGGRKGIGGGRGGGRRGSRGRYHPTVFVFAKCLCH